MKTSPVTTALPKTPVGFAEPQPFLYPKVALNIAAFGIVLGAAILFGVLTWWLHDTPRTGSFAVTLPIIGAVLLSAVGMIVVHEALHGLAYRLLGYRVSFGFILRMGAAYAAAERSNVTLTIVLLSSSPPRRLPRVCLVKGRARRILHCGVDTAAGSASADRA